jgi:putative FmdB family regulatory protein
MPLYEFRCPECETTFEARRPMAEASDPINCPNGHVGSRRLLSVFASTGSASSSTSASAPSQMPMGGGHGCGGGMCGC